MNNVIIAAAAGVPAVAFAWIAIQCPQPNKAAERDRQRALELAANRQDPDANAHQFRLADSPGDLNSWLARHGGTWQPDSLLGGMGLRISQPGHPDLVVQPGQTLIWDGERIGLQ
ncbi:hypothetical protein ADK55_29215 [Streptomyces sp. WM4235]|uniref:hypothetical protein n=1 Tax=Streptomyces sp. WM4235 TaxID=1415551 RepID=UPI0006AFFE1A|nr:hypothetical protein [Streptomyces sp. WM4235]KOU41268.1 hypothetical protein ADK55_29215 [Streptomyces sp. WM4235]